MNFNKLIPELSVSDLSKSQEFYVDVLGFQIEYQRVEDKFVFLSYQGSQIMIQEVNDNWSVGSLEKPFGRGINFQVETNEIVELQNKLKLNNITIFKEIFESKYKVNDMEFVEFELLVQDPDGYLLRFQQTMTAQKM